MKISDISVFCFSSFRMWDVCATMVLGESEVLDKLKILRGLHTN